MSDFVSKTMPKEASLAASINIEELVAGGEGQTVEFKLSFPEQARDFAKEVAAFASSNDGVVLLGVSDDGRPVGLADATSLSARDALTKRIQGACATIKPPVLAEVIFETLAGATIACVKVSRGSAPLYYVQHVPYVRHLSASRPAEPQEVIDRVLAWNQKGPSPEAQFLTGLGTLLTEVLARTGEAHEEDRDTNPQFDELRYYLGYYADEARREARRVPAELEGLQDRLRTLAGHLDGAAHEHLTLSSGFDEYLQSIDQAHEAAQQIMGQWLPAEKFLREAVATVEAKTREEAMAVIELAARGSDLAWGGRIDDLKREAGEHGYALLRLMAYGVGFSGSEVRERICAAARRLRAAEIQQMYMDGGNSVRTLLSEIEAAAAALSEALA